MDYVLQFITVVRNSYLLYIVNLFVVLYCAALQLYDWQINMPKGIENIVGNNPRSYIPAAI